MVETVTEKSGAHYQINIPSQQHSPTRFVRQYLININHFAKDGLKAGHCK